MFVELFLFFVKIYVDVFGIIEGLLLYDFLVVVVVLFGLDEKGGYKILFYEYDFFVGVGMDGKGERYEVSVVIEGSYEDVKVGVRMG